MKKEPFRRCIGCMESIQKSNLVRIVRIKDGHFEIDESGKMNGRGAYLCNNISCLLQARKRHGLERSFSTRINESVYDELERKLIHADD